MVEVVKVSELVRDVPLLEIIEGKECSGQKLVDTSDISRPGLELTGYFDFYPKNRIQFLGRTEISYSVRLDHDSREHVLNKMATPETSHFIVSRGLSIPSEMLEAAEKEKIPILSGSIAIAYLPSVVTQFLDEKLAPGKNTRGVLVEIYGMGILITGNSGAGKLETALDLTKRGRRLIADGRVDAYQKDDKIIVGKTPKILRHLMEIRGTGIIDVIDLFGVGVVKDSVEIQLIICLQSWDLKASYDRLGFNEKTREIFEVDIPQVTIPVKIGRDLAIIIEVTIMNFRAKKMDYDASQKFEQNLTELISDNSKKDEGESKK